MWAEDGAHWGWGGVCVRGCTGKGAREPQQRSLVEGSRRPRSQQGAAPPPVPRGHLAGTSLSPTSLSPAAALLPSEPVRPAPGQPPGAGAACWAAAPRPPGPRAGGSARRTAAWAGGGGRGQGEGRGGEGRGRGRAGRGVLASRRAGAGAAWAAALLPAAAAAEAAPRPTSSCLPLAARGCRAHWPEERRRRQELEASRPRVSVSRPAEVQAVPASGVTGTGGDSRLGRVGGRDRSGPRAGVLGLGCLGASLGRLGRLGALRTHPGDFGGCTALAADRGSGPLSGERARSRATAVLGRVG